MNILLTIAAFLMTAMPAELTMPAPQWRHPMTGIPRLPDGKPNLAAPAPRTLTGSGASGTLKTADRKKGKPNR